MKDAGTDAKDRNVERKTGAPVYVAGAGRTHLLANAGVATLEIDSRERNQER